MPIKKYFFATRRGDTILEVTIAITVFCLISIIGISLMNRDLSTIQGTLELETARNEVDAQAEALRFIHNSYLAERNQYQSEDELDDYDHPYTKLWRRIVSGTSHQPSLINNPTKISEFEAVGTKEKNTGCNAYYDTHNSSESIHNIFQDKAFILNTRNLDPVLIKRTALVSDPSSSLFGPTPLSPRLIFTSDLGGNSEENLLEQSVTEVTTFNKVAKVEGIWIIATRDMTGISNPESATDEELKKSTPEYFDFHIRTCWYAPSRSIPTTIGTIIRLHNPDYQGENNG